MWASHGLGEGFALTTNDMVVIATENLSRDSRVECDIETVRNIWY